MKVRLQPIAEQLNLPTVVKTAILPGDSVERVFIATQVGEIFYIGGDGPHLFLDIRDRIIRLESHDERGLIGLAFHPRFTFNGLFYLHYSVAGTQGPGALPEGFTPNPCDPASINLKWENRDERYDHIDTVEEWMIGTTGRPRKLRTLLNLRRPFMNHNGYNSLTFSPETGRLVLTTGDGGSGYDPFNLAQDELEIAGKIIEIDVHRNTNIVDPPIVTRFDELPAPIQETLAVIAKGVRNMAALSYQRLYDNRFMKYAGQVGQDLVEAVYSFIYYQPVPVSQLVQAAAARKIRGLRLENRLIDFGWRSWEGSFPTAFIRACSEGTDVDEKTIAYYREAIGLANKRLQPLTNYFHKDARRGKFSGTALTGVQVYMGAGLPGLAGSVVFTDLARKETFPHVRGALAYTFVRQDGRQNDYQLLEPVFDFGAESAYFVSLGANLNQTRLFLGVNGSASVTDFGLGRVFEILPYPEIFIALRHRLFKPKIP